MKVINTFKIMAGVIAVPILVQYYVFYGLYQFAKFINEDEE